MRQAVGRNCLLPQNEFSLNLEDNNTYSDDLLKVISFSDRVPYATKQANNFAWAKLRADAVDLQNSDFFDEEYIKIVEDNYRLMNGMPMVNYTAEAYRASMLGADDLLSEGIDMPSTQIEHFDYVSPFIDGLWGDQKRRKLRFTVTDSSLFTQNYIKEQKGQLLKNHFETKLINPTRQHALMKWQIDHGVQDLMSLKPDERKQLDSDINASMETLIPKDIMNFMKNGAQGKIEMQGQALAEALTETLRLKYLIDETYRDSFATDGAVFYNGVRRNKPFVEWVDLTKFNTESSGDIFIDKNSWFKRLMPKNGPRVWTEYGDRFTREDIKRFDEMVKTSGRGTTEAKDAQFATAIDFNGMIMLNETNLLTKDGQEKYSQILQKYQGSDIHKFSQMRVAHLVWQSLCKMRRITRGFADKTIRDEYFTEDYVFNPQLGDLEEKIVWVPQYWQATKIGQGVDPIFVDVGPVPFQFRDITDPYEVRSPYSGGFLSDMMGKGYRRSPLHKAKPFIHAVNFQMKTIRDREATDIGKVVLMTVAAKPKGWSWGKLIEVVRATKMLPINTQTGGLTPADVQFFREIDLSNLYDILPRINYIMFLVQRIGEILSSNAARQGNPAASTSVSNNMQNLNRSFSQTTGRSAWIDEITSHVLENLIYYGKSAVKSGNIFLRYALDDTSIANIDIDVDEIDDAYFGVKVTSDEMDMERLSVAQNLLVPHLQKNNVGYGLILETAYATSRGEFINIATKAELEIQMQQAQAADYQKMSAQEQSRVAFETEKALLELKSNLKMQEDIPNNEAKKEMAALSSMTIAHGNDLNQNNENDFTESAALERDFKREELFVKDALERDKLGLQDKWNTQELKILEDKVKELSKKMGTPPKKAKK